MGRGHLILGDGIHGLGQGGKLIAHAAVHLIQEPADNAVDTVDLIPCGAQDKAVHAVRHRRERLGHGELHVVRETVHQGVVDALEHEIPILILADELDVVIQGPGHGQLREGGNKIINGPVGGALGDPVEHVEDDAAGNTGYGGAKGKTHALQQDGDALHQLGGVREIQGGQAPGKAHKGAENTQGGQQIWDQLRQGRVAGTVGDGVVIDIILHVGGQTPAIQLLRILQEAEPGAAQARAYKTGLLPNGLGAGGTSRLRLQTGNGPAEGMGGIPEREKTFEHTDQRNNGNGSINQIIGQVREHAGDSGQIRHGIHLLRL